MNIEIKKYKIIQLIMSVADEQLIDQINSEVRQLIDTPTEETSTIKYNTGIREELDLEKIKKEQNYQGIDAKKMYRLIEEADIQEPIEELLKMI